MGRKYYIIAGEASGDMYGSSLVESMLKIESDLQFKGFGGEKMGKVGVDISIDIEKLSIIGFFEVLKNLRKILSYFKKAKSEIMQFQPDGLILIDYPGFNLRMAEWAKKRGIKVYYYIAPTVWAWGKGRIPKIKANIDKLFVIFPFEKEFFKSHGIESIYVGNPLMEEINKFKPDPDFLSRHNIPSESKKIAFFPGSRISELNRNIDPILPVIENNGDKIFIVAARSSLNNEKFIELNSMDNVRIVYDRNYDILKVADAGIIKSGTASLEAAIFKVPMVVIYKTGLLNQIIIKQLVTGIKYASLINLILNKQVVTELFQNEINPENVQRELEKILFSERRQQMLNDFEQGIKAILIDRYPSEVVAEEILEQ